MNNNTQILLHLSLIPNIGPATTLKILKKLFDDFCTSHAHPEISQPTFDLTKLYTFKINDFLYKFEVPPKAAQLLTSGLADTEKLNTELALIKKYNIHVTSFIDTDYPESLKQIYHPPLVLYTKGAKLDDSAKHLAIVGSRKATMYAHTVINQLIPELVSSDWNIVSGGALGVDTMAHQATLDHGGKTIVVFGAGLLQAYPKENRDLFRSIVKNGGTLVSPFPLNTPPSKGNFPARNRIISGLSPEGCLVVQAAQRSGALITAQFALDQGRQVFAIPGSIDEELSAGCHKLLKDGAKLVEIVEDIFEESGEEYRVRTRSISLRSTQGERIKSKNNSLNPAFALSGAKHQDAKRNRMDTNERSTPIPKKHPLIKHLKIPISLDELCTKTKQSLSELQDQLFELQLDGKVKQNFAGLWKKN